VRLLSVELINFQAHGKTLIEFAPITTIKGPTDAGKSAVIRALRWICLNDLAGDEFIKEGEKQSQILLRFRHNKKEFKAVRIRGSGDNTYELNGTEFKAFGTSVPANIAALFRVSEINFQSQHDSPFWFSESAAEVSRQLNSIVDLTVIDTTLAKIVAMVRQAQGRKDLIKERLAEAEQEYEKLKDQQPRIDEFKELKDLHEKANKAEASERRMGGLLKGVLSHRDNLQPFRQRAAEGTSLLESCKAAITLERKVSRLNELIGKVAYLQSSSTPPPPFDPVERAFQSWMELINKTQGLAQILSDLDKLTGRANARRQAMMTAEASFYERTKGKRCPLCGRVS